MKIAGFIMGAALLIAGNDVFAQQPSITVKAGTKIIDYFPSEKRFRYIGFQKGRVVFRDGTYTATRLNYNYLNGDMQFIQGRDTLSIANTDQIDFVNIDKDTFYFDNGYLEVLADIGRLRLVRKQYVKTVDIKKQEAYGMSSSASATTSYSSIQSGSRYYNLVVQQDVVVRMQKEFYMGSPVDGFQLFRKKFALEMFPAREAEIKRYLKENPVDFYKEEEVLEFSLFLKELAEKE